MARDPHRIRPFLRAIEHVWSEHPDMRFGQLLANIAGREDTWEWEDSRWFAAIDKFRSDMEADRADMVWIPAVPLPFIGIGQDRCGECGAKFRGRNRRHRYEIHYRREHGRSGSDTMTQVTREEAQRIHSEVAGDR